MVKIKLFLALKPSKIFQFVTQKRISKNDFKTNYEIVQIQIRF